MNTRKTIHKVYLAWDFKKEELWLNEMAAEGWALELSLIHISEPTRP